VRQLKEFNLALLGIREVVLEVAGARRGDGEGDCGCGRRRC
jgi:hypothetical protein